MLAGAAHAGALDTIYDDQDVAPLQARYEQGWRDHKASLRFMQLWLEQVERAGLPHGSSFDLDFHSVPANSAEEPLEIRLGAERTARCWLLRPDHEVVS